MKKSTIVLALALALMVSACAGDVTDSDEYRAPELEVAALEQQLAAPAVEPAVAQAAARPEVPAEVLALLDEWWAANERKDGSVAELYTASGYHLYGEEKISRDDLAAHYADSVSPAWITDPYLIVAEEPRGRYVVTRGVRVGGFSSALTFEILTMADGELRIAQTAWTYAH